MTSGQMDYGIEHAVVRGMVDRPRLAKIMGLSPPQQIIPAQSVGYPAVPWR